MTAVWPKYDHDQCSSYLKRINNPNSQHPLSPLAALASFHRSHLLHVPFTSLTIHLNPQNLPPRHSPIPHRAGPGAIIDPDVLYNKIVQQNGGGYCFENNLAFNSLLRGLGYKVTGRLARVNFSAQGSVSATPVWSGLSHFVGIAVTQPDPHVGPAESAYLCDVGFGGGGIFEPIELSDGATASHGLDLGTKFEVRRERLPGPAGDEDTAVGWTLYKTSPQTKGLTVPLYHVYDTYVHYPQDLRSANVATSVDEEYSRFARGIVVQLPCADGSMTVVQVEKEGGTHPSDDRRMGGWFYTRWPDGRREDREYLSTTGALEDVLVKEFGIQVSRRNNETVHVN